MLNELKRDKAIDYLYVWFFLFALIHFGIFVNNFIFDSILNYKYPSMFLVIYAFMYILPSYLAGYGIFKKREWSWNLALLVSIFHLWLHLNLNVDGAPFISQIFYYITIVLFGVSTSVISVQKLIEYCQELLLLKKYYSFL